MYCKDTRNNRFVPQENGFYHIVNNSYAPITDYEAPITTNCSSSPLRPSAAAPSLPSTPRSVNNSYAPITDDEAPITTNCSDSPLQPSTATPSLPSTPQRPCNQLHRSTRHQSRGQRRSPQQQRASTSQGAPRHP